MMNRLTAMTRVVGKSIRNSRSMSTKPAVLTSGDRMTDEVCIVTGGAGGIGRATALLFAKQNASGVVVADVNEAAGQETVKMITDLGKKAIFVKTDVSKGSDVSNLVETCEKEFGKLTVMFNNAGIMMGDDDTVMVTEDDVWKKTLDINVMGVKYGCQYGIPAMLRAGGGSIINTASFVAILGAGTPQIAYTASKGAVLAMTRELAVTHARENIRVNALCPGPVRTPLLMDFLNTEEKKQRRLVHVPVGRFGESEEMAMGALFLASKEASFVTGTDFLVDGGVASAYTTPL